MPEEIWEINATTQSTIKGRAQIARPPKKPKSVFRKIIEGIIVTVVGGLILWSLTELILRPLLLK